jgi:hypothetical protein
MMGQGQNSTMRKRDRRGIEALDQDALDDLDFANRGRPDGEIGYSDDAPRLSKEQLGEFEPASIRFFKKRRATGSIKR